MDFTSIHTIQPYGRKLIISTPTSQDDIKLMEDKWGLRNENDQLCGIYNTKYEQWYAVMAIFNMAHIQTVTYGMIAHESLHIMDSVLQGIGHSYVFDNNETGAYLIEWISGVIFQHLHDRDLIKDLTIETQIKKS